MKSFQLALMLAVLAVPLAGCEQNDSTAYDPRVDGVVPPNAAQSNASMLEDQAAIYKKMYPSAAVTASPVRGNSATPAKATSNPAVEPANPQ